MARVAQFIDTLDAGGAERVLVDLSAGLAAQGHQVEVHHLGNPWIERQCRRFNLESVPLARRGWYRSKWSVGAFAAAYGVTLRRRHVDLLHSHLNGPIVAGALASLVAGIPHVGTLHDIYHVTERPRSFELLRGAALVGTQLVAVSADMQRFYRSRARRRVHVELVYNGVDVEAFPRPTRAAGGRFTFICVGRLVALKNHDLLLRALAQTGPDGPSLRFLGEGEARGALEALVRELGLGERVEFLGFREEIAALLAEADGFVLASRSEGLSCSIMEAMAAGLPCLVTDVGGNRELVVPGVNGLLVPAGDVAALAAGMRLLATDPGRAAAFGSAARERAEVRFSLGATVQAYEAIYRSMLPGGLVREARRTAPLQRTEGGRTP